jgi:hypothetical protein
MSIDSYEAANLTTTFRSFYDVCHSLYIHHCRKLQPNWIVVSKKMELLISKLRSVDEEIILLLAERITISRSIGELKREQKIEI